MFDPRQPFTRTELQPDPDSPSSCPRGSDWLISSLSSYVRERVDSPMETRLRLLLVLSGLPEPEVNLRILGDSGKVLLRPDLSYPSVKLAVEYDGWRPHFPARA